MISVSGIPLLLFLGGFFFLPLLALLPLGIEAISDSILSDPFIWHVIQFTYFQAFLSATASVLVGFGLALLITEWKVPGSRMVWKLSLLCSAMPPMVVALGILGAAEPNGVFGWKGILWGHVFLNFAIPLRLIGTSLSERNKSAELTALSLGMPRLQTFFHCTWLEIRTSVASSWLLTFLYSASSLFVVLFLGGGPRLTTLEVLLYESVKLNLDWGKALQIAVLQLLLGSVILVFYFRLQSRRHLQADKSEYRIYNPRSRTLRGFGFFVLGSLVVFGIGFPVSVILIDGFLNVGALQGSELLVSSGVSLAIAFAVACLSLVLVYPFLRSLYRVPSTKLQSLGFAAVALPQFFSSLLVALALSVFFPLFRQNASWSFVGVILTQTLLVIPLIVFPLKEGFLRMPPEKMWVAQSLGANKWQCWRLIEFPAMKRPLMLALLMAVSFSLGEVSSVLLFAPPGAQPLSLSVFQAMSRYRFQEAHALTMLLLLMIASVLSGVGYLEEES